MRSRLSRSAGAAGGTTFCSSNLEHGRVPRIWRAGTIHLVTRMAADGGDGGAELSHPAAGPEPGRGHRPACLHPAEIPDPPPLARCARNIVMPVAPVLRGGDGAVHARRG